MTQPIQLINQVYAIEVPNPSNAIVSSNFITWRKGEAQGRGFVTPPPGNWQLICTTKECKKKVPNGIVECKVVEYDGGIKGTRFVNYLNDDQRTWFINKTDSFRSLMVARALDAENKNYVLIKKVS